MNPKLLSRVGWLFGAACLLAACGGDPTSASGPSPALPAAPPSGALSPSGPVILPPVAPVSSPIVPALPGASDPSRPSSPTPTPTPVPTPSGLPATGSSSTAAPAPAPCAGQTLNWSVNAQACSAGVAFNFSGNISIANDTTGPVTGLATYQCSNGMWTLSPGAAAPTCDFTGPAAPTSVSYSPTVATLYQNQPGATLVPTIQGGAPTSWSIAPSLPPGLTLHPTTGVVSGTPTAATATASYTVTASNATGSATAAFSLSVQAVGNTVLMFVAYNDVWWAEYKVMYEALLAAGYQVDVRSSEPGIATSYQLGGEATIQTSADNHPGGYAGFTQVFGAQFGAAWNPAWNTPAGIPVNGRIQDVASMAPYVAFVAAGGTGAQDYVYDGSYSAQGPAGHMSSAANVQAAAQSINTLVVQALQAGKPVLTQCHGAKLAAFVRAPGSAGLGFDGLGTSILQGRSATGFHLDAVTAGNYNDLGVSYLNGRPVVIDGPAPANLGGSSAGRSRVITTRDWYPQTVAHATSALLNVLRSYPSQAAMSQNRKALVIHGGPVVQDVLVCAPSNKTSNDVPCNWGTNWPADHTHLQNLLGQASPNDPFSFTVSNVNLMGPPGSLPFNPASTASVRAYLDTFDVVVYFKHWATGMTPQIESALLQFADGGGGVVALHHGLYNEGGINALAAAFGAESNAATWVGSTNPQAVPSPTFMNVNYGQFVTSYATSYGASLTQPAPGFPAAPAPPNTNAAGYPSLPLADELYLNMAFLPGATFGAGQGQIQLLLANNHVAAPAQTLTAGFSRLYNPSGDATVGRLVYLQPGETIANYAVGSAYGQMIRNAALWASLAQ